MKIIIIFLLPLLIISCSSLVLTQADFSWPVESVLIPDEDGFVKEERYSFSFNSKNLFLEETGDSLAYFDKEVRIIRDTRGYYYITSNNFKNVYVFENRDGALKLEKKLSVSETGITRPAFNQRPPYVELVDGNNKHLLTYDGIAKEG
jgi:hypothetical protein